MQIATIVRWVDAGSPKGDPKDMPAAKQWPTVQEWQLASRLRPTDFVVKSDVYTMAAHGQDVWWKPVSPIPVTEPRWVRAVEIRPDCGRTQDYPSCPRPIRAGRARRHPIAIQPARGS